MVECVSVYQNLFTSFLPFTSKIWLDSVGFIPIFLRIVLPKAGAMDLGVPACMASFFRETGLSLWQRAPCCPYRSQPWGMLLMVEFLISPKDCPKNIQKSCLAPIFCQPRFNSLGGSWKDVWPMLQCQSCAFVTSACDASLWDYGSLTIPFLRNGPCDVRHENSKNSRIDKPTWHRPIQRPPFLRKPYWGSHSQWSTSLRHNGRLGCASSLPHIYKPPTPLLLFAKSAQNLLSGWHDPYRSLWNFLCFPMISYES